MDPNTPNNESAPFKIPEVQIEDTSRRPEALPETDANNIEEDAMAKAVESGAKANSFSGLSNQPQQQSTAIDPSILVPPAQTTATGTGKQITVITDNLQAGDADLIEKAWVVKAKAIVERTKDNPYEQTREIKKIKADYQKKRFNTDLKIEEE